MASTIYRRHSMAQLYENLRAQDDDDDTAWLAQFSPDDKFDEPYVPPALSPPSLSTISSVSPISSYSSSSSTSNPTFDTDSGDEFFDLDSDSDVDRELVSFELPFAEVGVSPDPPFFPEAEDLPLAMEPSDSPYLPPVRELSDSPPQSRSTPPLVEYEALPVPILPPFSITPLPSPRSTRKSSAGKRSPDVIQDSEGVYSESDGDGSEDEYVPSPTLGSKKRHRSSRSGPSSRKRGIQGAPRKRARHSPHPRNVQAAPGLTPGSPTAKNNPWACPHCKWVQRNHRTPDLKRHIRTHTRLQRPAQWVCCGVPLSDAHYYDIPADAESYEWGGEEMIGGCCKEFSRRDALKRHLDNEHIHCVGNFAAFATICEEDV